MKKFLVFLSCLIVLFLMSSCLTLSSGTITTITDTITKDGHLVEQAMCFSRERVQNEHAYFTYYDRGYSHTVHAHNHFFAYLGKELLNDEVKRWFLQLDCFTPLNPKSFDRSEMALLLDEVLISVDGIVYPFRTYNITYQKELAYQSMYDYTQKHWDAWHAQVRFTLDKDFIETLSTASEVKILYYNNPSVASEMNGTLITIDESVLLKLQKYLSEAQSEATLESLYAI